MSSRNSRLSDQLGIEAKASCSCDEPLTNISSQTVKVNTVGSKLLSNMHAKTDISNNSSNSNSNSNSISISIDYNNNNNNSTTKAQPVHSASWSTTSARSGSTGSARNEHASINATTAGPSDTDNAIEASLPAQPQTLSGQQLPISRRFSRLPLTARIRLTFMVVMAYAQVVSGIVVLVLSAKAREVSDRPLRAFIIAYITRLLLYYPLQITKKLCSEGEDWAETPLGYWLNTLRKILGIAAVVLFILGNYWTFTSETSVRTAPLLYYTSLTYIALGYLLLATPVLGVMLFIICFPFIYIFMRQFRVAIHAKKGANFEQISKIPLVRYVIPATSFSPPQSPQEVKGPFHAQDPQLAQNPSNAASNVDDNSQQHSRPASPRISHSAAASLRSVSQRQRYGLSRIHIINPFARIAHRLTRSKRQRAEELELYKKQLSGPIPDFTPPGSDDSMCAICLCEYENGDILRMLPCSHHLHQTCVDEWLHINRSCPLCKRSAAPEVPAEEAATESTNTTNSLPTVNPSQRDPTQICARPPPTAPTRVAAAGI